MLIRIHPPGNPNDEPRGLPDEPANDGVDKNTNKNAGGSTNTNSGSDPSGRGSNHPDNIRSRTWTASGRNDPNKNGIRQTEGEKRTDNKNEPSTKNNDYHHASRPRSWTGRSHHSHSQRNYNDKRKSIPCKFAIHGQCRYTDAECYYYHPKEHQMIYYRGPNWIPNKQQTSQNHQLKRTYNYQQREPPNPQQKEIYDNDLLRSIQNLNSLITRQMQRQEQNSPQQQPLNQTIQNNPQNYPMMTEDIHNQNSYNHPTAYDAYNHQYDRNFQQVIDNNIATPTYDTNSLIYVNQTSH